ncbi:MAG: SDR family NAD(P)-dependent oxidoreductase [Halioglobus sp.]|nr:SDR family NAD(P)-dependent oxidoreductase [Halioglobus sp.]
MHDLRERYGDNALVTGASSGIGEQFARQLAASGFNLLITARRQQQLQELADELTAKHPIDVQVLACDLGEGEQLDALIEKARSMRIGLVVSNAGFGAKGEFLDHDYVQTESMYQTNSIAPSKLAYHLLPHMVENRRGGFIFTGSVEGEVAFPYSAPYAASKAFLHSLARSLWLEMKPHNVDILLLAPGSTDTAAPIQQGVTRDQLIGLQAPAFVAQQALNALGRRMVITPGVVNASFISFLKMLPRRWSTTVAGLGMKKALENSKRQSQAGE